MVQQLETVEQSQDLEFIRRGLLSKKDAVRKCAEKELGGLSADQLIKLMSMEQRCRTMRTRWLILGSVGYLCMVAAIVCPTPSPRRMCSRNMSPVEICGIPSDWTSSFACVPFPDPGEPNNTSAIGMA